MLYHITRNTASAVALKDIPTVDYIDLYNDLAERMRDERYHPAHYFAAQTAEGLRFFLLLLDDRESTVMISSFVPDYYSEEGMPSLTAVHPSFHVFEREMHELYGIRFNGHPWCKPLRFPWDRRDKNSTMDSYPFYCNGEQVLHLEIALGYQHRGVEREMTRTQNSLRRALLGESVAGDTAVAHATAYADLVEKLSGGHVGENLVRERGVALELERIAMHIADTGALSMDIGFQLFQVACEALRTMTINTTQAWCGNRFGKGLIRPFGSFHPLTADKAAMIRSNIADIRRRYNEVRLDMKESPSLLARFEQCGVVPREEMLRIGGVGTAARASGLLRDLRSTHPFGVYTDMICHDSIVKRHGDVMARLMMRCREVLQSADYIESLLSGYEPAAAVPEPRYDVPLAADALSFSLVEGWRGEICHVALTDARGSIVKYKIKDPSLHNWLALALAVRGEGISDFPICNKSFNLSYCGHDL